MSKKVNFGIRTTRDNTVTNANIKIPPLSTVLGEILEESQFTVKRDLNLNNLLTTNSMKLPVKTYLPVIGRNGEIIFNQYDNSFYGYNGTTWISLSGGGGGVGTLEQVLAEGSSAGNQNITDVDTIIVDNVVASTITTSYLGTLTSLITNLTTTSLSSTTGVITNLTASSLSASFGLITNLTTTSLSASTLTAAMLYAPGVFVKLGSYTAVTDVTSMSISNIDQSYNHLKVYIYGRSTRVINTAAVDMQFNNDTSLSYGRYTASYSGNTYFNTIGILPGSTSTFQQGFLELTIPNYRSPSIYKTVLALSGTIYTQSGGATNFSVGSWYKFDAINKIFIYGTAALSGFQAGSGIEVYGFK